MSIAPLGLGIGWRPELALFIERCDALHWVEIVAENFSPPHALSPALARLRERGRQVVPHGISLSLGGTQRLDRARLQALRNLARTLDAPLVSEHIAFVRSGGVEAGHLLPVPRTREQLAVLVRNIRDAQAMLDTPLAVENIAALLDWPGGEMDEATFLGEIIDQTGAMLLLDLANVHANARNRGGDGTALLEALPLDRIAYVHVAGGEERDGIYHDTHAAPTPPEVFTLVEALCARHDVPGLMLERDAAFPPDDLLRRELDALAGAVATGRERRVVRA